MPWMLLKLCVLSVWNGVTEWQRRMVIKWTSEMNSTKKKIYVKMLTVCIDCVNCQKNETSTMHKLTEHQMNNKSCGKNLAKFSCMEYFKHVCLDAAINSWDIFRHEWCFLSPFVLWTSIKIGASKNACNYLFSNGWRISFPFQFFFRWHVHMLQVSIIMRWNESRLFTSIPFVI